MSIKERFLVALVLLLTISLISVCFSYLDIIQTANDERNMHDLSDDISIHHLLQDPNPKMKSPKIAWLMSYPNSGTSYTLRLVQRSGNATVATNYGAECEFNENGENQPLYPDTSPDGPWVLNPNYKLPPNYILTKTHCGGRCNNCGPEKYIETKLSFLNECASGARVSLKNMEKQMVKYDAQLVQRAIHLVRDPFNNIVSNFHLERHQKMKKQNKAWLDTFPNDAVGFRKWCHDIDLKFIDEEFTSRLLPRDVTELFGSIPCHKSFFVISQWHNLAIRVISDLRLPSIVIHYEDYESSFNSTTEKIFDFLQLPVGDNIPGFLAGKEYRDFYSSTERQAARRIVEYVSDGDAWSLLQRYFDE